MFLGLFRSFVKRILIQHPVGVSYDKVTNLTFIPYKERVDRSSFMSRKILGVIIIRHRNLSETFGENCQKFSRGWMTGQNIFAQFLTTGCPRSFHKYLFLCAICKKRYFSLRISELPKTNQLQDESSFAKVRSRGIEVIKCRWEKFL